MKRFAIGMVCLAVTSGTALAQQTPGIYAPDGTYLGRLNSNRFDPDSVSNPYGQYGSRFAPDGINNPYSQYGSRFSPNSVRNPYTQ